MEQSVDQEILVTGIKVRIGNDDFRILRVLRGLMLADGMYARSEGFVLNGCNSGLSCVRGRRTRALGLALVILSAKLQFEALHWTVLLRYRMFVTSLPILGDKRAALCTGIRCD